MGFISWLISGALSPILNTVSNIFSTKENATIEEFKVQGQVDIETLKAYIALMQTNAELLQNKWLVAMQCLFALPLAFYYGKIHVWDAALGWGHSNVITGSVDTWDMWVMGFLFLHSAVISWKRKT